MEAALGGVKLQPTSGAPGFPSKFKSNYTLSSHKDGPVANASDWHGVKIPCQGDRHTPEGCHALPSLSTTRCHPYPGTQLGIFFSHPLFSLCTPLRCARTAILAPLAGPFVVHLKPALVELAKEYQAKGVAVVAISSNSVQVGTPCQSFSCSCLVCVGTITLQFDCDSADPPQGRT